MPTMNMNQRELARRLGVNHVHLNAVLRGRKRPSPILARRIERETEGHIKAADLLPEVFGPMPGGVAA